MYQIGKKLGALEANIPLKLAFHSCAWYQYQSLLLRNGIYKAPIQGTSVLCWEVPLYHVLSCCSAGDGLSTVTDEQIQIFYDIIKIQGLLPAVFTQAQPHDAQ